MCSANELGGAALYIVAVRCMHAQGENQWYSGAVTVADQQANGHAFDLEDNKVAPRGVVC